jgi:hypothetical protein
MFYVGIDMAAEQRRHELLDEAERDRLAVQAREYAKRNPHPTWRPTDAIPHRLRLGFVAALRSKLRPTRPEGIGDASATIILR